MALLCAHQVSANRSLFVSKHERVNFRPRRATPEPPLSTRAAARKCTPKVGTAKFSRLVVGRVLQLCKQGQWTHARHCFIFRRHNWASLRSDCSTSPREICTVLQDDRHFRRESCSGDVLPREAPCIPEMLRNDEAAANRFAGTPRLSVELSSPALKPRYSRRLSL